MPFACNGQRHVAYVLASGVSALSQPCTIASTLPLLLGIHFKQAIEALEDVQIFLEHRGYVEQAISVGKVMINLAGISVYNYTQTTIIIDQYFS